MIDTIRSYIVLLIVILLASLLVVIGLSVKTSALQPIPTPDPKPGSYGLEATKRQPPPTRGATITTPGNGASYSTSPITVAGICPTGLLVQIYNNAVMVGAVMCESSSFSLQVSLFPGTNELSAAVFDDTGQQGPASNVVSVTYSNTQFAAFGESITLTSTYGRRAAPVSSALSWPLQLTGGTGPYAFSIDWGDGSKPELKSQALAGVVTINHAYKQAGIYRINITVTDVNGVSAFLQVIAVVNGEATNTSGSGDTDEQATERTEILWAPAAVSAGLMLPAFWFGRKSQLVSLRNKMLKERDSVQEK